MIVNSTLTDEVKLFSWKRGRLHVPRTFLMKQCLGARRYNEAPMSMVSIILHDLHHLRCLETRFISFWKSCYQWMSGLEVNSVLVVVQMFCFHPLFECIQGTCWPTFNLCHVEHNELWWLSDLVDPTPIMVQVIIMLVVP